MKQALTRRPAILIAAVLLVIGFMVSNKKDQKINVQKDEITSSASQPKTSVRAVDEVEGKPANDVVIGKFEIKIK